MGLFVAVLMTAVYFLWTTENSSRSITAAADNFDRRAQALARAVFELRMAQQAYVAAGQGDEFWSSKVSAQISQIRDELTALRSDAPLADAQSHLDDAMSSLEDFERMDARAREYARSNQRLLASDLIFSDGLEKSTEILEALEHARATIAAHQDGIEAATRRRELLIAAGAAAAALVIGLALVPLPRHRTIRLPVDSPALSQSESADSEDRESLPLRDVRDPMPPLPTVTPPSLRETTTEALDPFDLGRVASLCTELARIVDTHSLPAVLEQTASVLDANGVVLWIADPDGRELNAIITHGYPAQMVTRLGTIPRDAPNATAAAFRTALLQTVQADSISNGAIAVPLVTPSGCVGVMAAEVRHGGEKQDAKLAAAAIVAAQLATLVGPPSSRPQVRPAAANA
jgi:GAF domain-containing protein